MPANTDQGVARVLIGAWTALLVAGVLAGASLCAAIVAPRRRVWLAAIAGTAALVGLAASVVAIWRLAPRNDAPVLAGFLGIGAAVGGFALAASLWPDLLARRRAASLALAPGDDDGAIHVILLAEAEPEDYSPAYLAAAMRDLEESDVPVPPDVVRTLFYAQERARYRRVGGSPARPTARSVAVRTSSLLHDEGFDGHASVAYCGGSPTLAEDLAAGVRAGGRRFIVALLTTADSREVDRAKRDAAALELWRSGVEVAYTSPLWSATGVTEMLAGRVMEAFGSTDCQKNGVVLVAEGQPWQWDRTHPAAAEHATFMCQRVRAELVSAGLSEDKVRMAWMEWDDPGVTEVVRHLAALGCRRIVILPATLPADCIATLLDLRAAADQAAVDEGVAVAVLPAWGDDPAVADALCDRILEAAAELEQDDERRPADADGASV